MGNDADRPYDLVLFGATGFVGRLLADYVARAAPPGTRVALAGRSASRLEAVRAGLPDQAAGWPVVEADVQDPRSIRSMADSARVVATTVGPYVRYGLPLVEACAAAGTSYVDLTGEVLFVRQSIDAAHSTASRTGSRIVHSCGFDSVPSDLGVLLAAAEARRDGAGELVDAVLVLESVRGGVSGGTVDSLRAQIEASTTDSSLRALVADPYALSPDRDAEPDLGPQRDLFVTRREPLLGGRWVAPFVMASFNTRVVRRSNALQGWGYGRSMRYREAVGVGTGPLAPGLATAVALGTGALAGGMAFGPTRSLLNRVLPAPGEGPDENARRRGRFRTVTTARTTTGRRYAVTIAAQGDPGYAATAVMIGESALALAAGDGPDVAGVLTPATGIGQALGARLRSAGFTVDTEQLGEAG